MVWWPFLQLTNQMTVINVFIWFLFSKEYVLSPRIPVAWLNPLLAQIEVDTLTVWHRRQGPMNNESSSVDPFIFVHERQVN